MKLGKQKTTILELIAYSITVIGIAVVVWFLVRLYVEGYINPSNKLSLENASNIGSFIGGFVGVFFTIVGVFLLFENLRMQRRDLRESKDLLQLQSFEGTFFNLINSQSQIINQIEYYYSFQNQSREIKARKFFQFVKDDFKIIYELISSEGYKEYGNDDEKDYFTLRFFQNEIIKFKKEDVSQIQQLHFCYEILNKLKVEGRFENELSKLKECYNLVFNNYHHVYGHYFRHLYHILKYIWTNEQRDIMYNKENIFEIHKRYKSYSDLVQAQMSSDELLILFLNGLCFKEMKKLIHRYGLLENLAVDDLLKPEHQNLYGKCSIDGEEYPAIIFKSRKDLVR